MNESPLYQSYRSKVQGTTINGVTLLSTDYLNHFNEAVMLLEIVPDMPDMIDDVREWRPKTYQEHFADSQFKMRDLAIEAFDHSPPEFRQPFDAVVSRLNSMVVAAVESVGEAIAKGDTERLPYLVADVATALRTEIDRAGAIVNGSADRMAQDDVDALFGDLDGDAGGVPQDNGDIVPPPQQTSPPEFDAPFDVAIAFSRGVAEVICNGRIGAAKRNCIGDN